MSRSSGKRPSGAEPQAPSQLRWGRRLAAAVALWMLPVAALWLLATPFYNRFLTEAAENLVRLTESPRTTRLVVHDAHHLVVTRTDFPSSRGSLASIRTTDTHFPLILLGAFFLGVPGVRWRRRLENLGWAALISIFFHIGSLFFRVKSIYATQLGAWSAEHYGPWEQNFWGLSSHLLEIPFKLALPFVLWAAFYVRELLPGDGAG